MPMKMNIDEKSKMIIKFMYMVKYHWTEKLLKLDLLFSMEEILFLPSAYGYVDIIILLVKESKCPWHENCLFASYNGHLECLKYLHENGCPWNESSCQQASMYGKLRCLIYHISMKMDVLGMKNEIYKIFKK